MRGQLELELGCNIPKFPSPQEWLYPMNRATTKMENLASVLRVGSPCPRFSANGLLIPWGTDVIMVKEAKTNHQFGDKPYVAIAPHPKIPN